MQMLCAAPRVLVIHGNYLDAEEIDFLAETASQFSLVYCPRTHAFFGHSAYPLAKLVKKGVTVCLGTDSRASNPNLDLFEEVKFVARHHADVDPLEIVRMATIQGTAALHGREAKSGLIPGAVANLTIVGLPDRASNAAPLDLLFDEQSYAIGAWHNGAKQTVDIAS
jgi:cytosine/adenosine deaminase-related metal-dependent hydrolase